LNQNKIALVSRTAKAAAIGLAVLCLAACPPPLGDDYFIDTVTIYNVPRQIPVLVKYLEPPPPGGTRYNETYKMYLSASDYMDADKPHKAQASALVTDGVFDAASGTYTVTLELRRPIPGHSGDPDDNMGPWSGTAGNFSVTLSPRDVTADGQRAIYIKASDKGLNRGTANIDWTKDLSVDFNVAIANGVTFMDLGGKAEAIYEDIVLKDDAITK